MVGTISVAESAKKSNFPLQPFFAFASAPSHVRIVDVPKQLGSWKITSVNVDITYPDGTSITTPCTLVGGCWSCTFNGCATVGKVQNGATVKADGIDELCQPVSGYVLGKGDVIVLEAGFDVDPDAEQVDFMRLYSTMPVDAKAGAFALSEEGWMVYTLSSGWQKIGLTEGDLSSKADLSSLQTIGDSLSSKADLSAVEEVVISLSSKADLSTIEELSNDLSAKQDVLTQTQIDAVNSVVDERLTYVTYMDDTTVPYDIVGAFTSQSIQTPSDASDIKFGNTVTSIGDDALFGCVYLYRIKIPDSVTYIGHSSFLQCDGIVDLDLGNNVKRIGAYAFDNCAIANLVIPDSVTSISASAFANCDILKKVTVGKNVANIGADAFANCLELSSITFNDKTPAQVSSMANYPWGISDTTIITTWHDASQEWVQEQIGNVNTTLEEIVG